MGLLTSWFTFGLKLSKRITEFKETVKVVFTDSFEDLRQAVYHFCLAVKRC